MRRTYQQSLLLRPSFLIGLNRFITVNLVDGYLILYCKAPNLEKYSVKTTISLSQTTISLSQTTISFGQTTISFGQTTISFGKTISRFSQ